MTTHGEQFVVDAALLEELGARLIGRPDVALGELVKNAYDADAATCKITFEKDQIEIVDDGHGMSVEEFHSLWLRLGTTHKSEKKTSRGLKRPLTGSKGIGRLSAQFLATRLQLWTTAEEGKTIYADVDWTKIVHGSELSSFTVKVDDDAPAAAYPYGSPTGTKLVLSRRRQEWGQQAFSRLGRDLWMLRNPFRRMRGQRAPETRSAADFEIELAAPEIQGAQSAFEAAQTALVQDVWKARISGQMARGRDGGSCRIEVEFRDGYPDGSPKKSYIDVLDNLPLLIPDDEDDHLVTDEDRRPHLHEVGFTILIYNLVGLQPGRLTVSDLRDFLKEQGNIRIYDAGFRLPFYGPNEDWLRVSADQAGRISKSQLLPDRLDTDQRYLLDLPDPRTRTLGAVEINTAVERAEAERRGASPGHWLEIQASRDRLQANVAFEQLRRLVRYSVDFYANRYAKRKYDAAQLGASIAGSPSQAQEKARSAWEDVRRHLPPDTVPPRLLADVEESFQRAETAVKSAEAQLNARAALLAPLAAAGMRAVALDHELRREISSLERTANLLDDLAKSRAEPDLSEAASEVRKGLERLRAIRQLFEPLLNDDDRTARERYRVLPLLQTVIRSMSPLLPGISIETDIPTDLRLPSAPYAAWSAMFQNILSNAWDAMLESAESTIRVDVERDRRKTKLRFSDKGVGLRVPLENSDKLFDPFETIDLTGPERRSLRQGGSGLGLAIVRMIAGTHGCEVAFVEPIEGFSTTLEVRWNE